MNKKVWVGVYAASVALFVLTLVFGGLLLLMQVDQVYEFGPNFIIGLAVIAALMYLQFAVVQTVYGFLLLGKMWGSIQDGVTPISVGKAIGFLFIPIFSVYWIFVAWGGFPRHYNDYIERYKLNAPYLSGGIYTALPIVMLLSGILVFPIIALPVVFAFVIAQTCDAVNNLKQATEDRRSGIVQTSRQEQQIQTPKSKFVPAAIGGLAVAGVLLCFGFVVFAARNLRPAMTANEVPETVGKYKKDYSFASGSIFGLRSEYFARYKPADNDKTKDSIEYQMVDFSREADAVKRLKTRSYCSPNTTKKEGALKDKSGAPIGDYMICGSDYFYFRAKKKFISLSKAYSSITADDVIQFFVNLPYNADVNTEEIAAALKAMPLYLTTLSTTKTGSPKAPAAPGDKADFTFTAAEFYKEIDGANAAKSKMKFAGKIVEIAGRIYKIGGGETVNLHAGKNTVSMKVAAESQGKTESLKEDERAIFKCRADDSSYRAELVNCLLIETKGILSLDEKPDFTFTAKEYFKEVDGKQSYESKSKKQDFYAGKIIELSGAVKAISNKKQYLTVAEYEWINCKPDAENEAQFDNLTEGQEVKLKGIGSRYGTSLEHCLVVSQ